MSEQVTFLIDGVEVKGRRGQMIIEAAEEAGIYIPRLCHKPGLTPHGSCRVCTVKINGRPMSACTTPVGEGQVIESETEELFNHRKNLIEMLFVEGNHYCMFCEKSGACELQALAYRFGITAPKYPYLFPVRDVDATHPDVMIDRNRCILCGRCARTSQEKDGKHVFDFVGRGPEKQIAVNADTLGATDAEVTDAAMDACPVGAILKKRTGYVTPIGQRQYDFTPIGSDIESK